VECDARRIHERGGPLHGQRRAFVDKGVPDYGAAGRTLRNRNGVPHTSSNEMQQVAVAHAAVLPNFTVDNTSGNKGAIGANGGHRIAGDRRSGAVQSLYQAAANAMCPNSALPISYMLNRSTDGGITWALNGQANGIPAAVVCSNQLAGIYAFGQTTPGDIVSGDVYVVYGVLDPTADRDRIALSGSMRAQMVS
jgi:hypothetical protein